MKYLFIIAALLLLAAPASGERYEYRSEVNRVIPDYDSTGVVDVILVPAHVRIEDINFFIGIGTEEHHGWAEQVWIDVYSQNGTTVRLNAWEGDPISWYFFWYDTDRPVDGPGSLDDYVGMDAYGRWTMHAFDMVPDREVTWYYWLIEVIGEPLTSVEPEEKEGLPAEYFLNENYPNPFNSTTRIEFGLPADSEVKVEVYDVVGRKVITLVDDVLPAGFHNITWNGENSASEPVASGVYLIRMTAPNRSFDRKAILLK
jgi:hypothetical protein